jgi:hypothetical protein
MSVLARHSSSRFYTVHQMLLRPLPFDFGIGVISLLHLTGQNYVLYKMIIMMSWYVSE